MQSRKTGVAERRDPRQSEHDTVAYRGPQLDELIAASTEVRAARAYDSDTRVEVGFALQHHEYQQAQRESAAYEAREEQEDYETVESGEFAEVQPFEQFERFERYDAVRGGEAEDVPVSFVPEGTILARLPTPAPTSAPFFPPPAPLPRPVSTFLSSATPSSIVALVTDLGSVPPPAISYAIPTDEDDEPIPRFRSSTRIVYAISVAVLGMMCGGIFTTSLASDDDDASAAPLRTPEVRTREDQRTSLDGTLREKVSKAPLKRR